MSKHYRWLVFVVLLFAFGLWASLPSTEGLRIDLNNDGENEVDLALRQSLGLDLVGGLRVLLQAELPPDQYSSEDLQNTANNVSRRVNALGLTEATVQVQGNRRILVEIPGITDTETAINTIQRTALLEFVDFSDLSFEQVQSLEGRPIRTTYQLQLNNQFDPAAGVNPLTGLPFETVITGAGLSAAQAQSDPTTGAWSINFALNEEGQDPFFRFTSANINRSMAIVLDGVVLSAPTIQAALDTGGVITGRFTEEEARQLALQLRSGALRIPLSVENTAFVGATLGQQSVQLSIRAGIIGVIIVFTFMLVYYRVPGLAAVLALAVFIVLNLMVFKLIPVTLTLAAITGFLISIGTAVDGNILIFERVKEEIRNGKPLFDALDAGFDRAWVSIRDSNFSTILICAVLFFFGQTPGASIVSGFAVTLALGLIINLFTAVFVTRTFLYIFADRLRQPLSERKWLLGI
ncbi:MAG: protein translocase subunit SecD [Anaerolineae bacterium]|nr:protein translocase subunit SecD [Anaerolineae bacterium]